MTVVKVLKEQSLVDLSADFPNTPHQELLQVATLSTRAAILTTQAPCMCIHFHTVLQYPDDEPEVRQGGPRKDRE